MQPERARLKRLQRLERVRAIAKQTAAVAAAEAEGTLAQLQALAQRTGRLAADYTGRSDAGDGMALQQLTRFVGGLQGISAATLGDAARARDLADRMLAELAAAERRRAAVEDRATRQERALTARSKPVSLTARRGFGTGLE